MARTKLIVATDEPTSLTDAYAFIKLAHRQEPQGETGGPDLRIVVNMATSPAEGERTYATLLKACESFLKISPRLAGVIRRDSKVKDSIRSEERRVGKECVIQCQSRWARVHLTKKKENTHK